MRVGRVNGQFIANPTHVRTGSESDLDLVYVGNEKDIVMYEGAAKEITEADFAAALKFAQEACQPIIAAQKELAAKAGKKSARSRLNIVPTKFSPKPRKLSPATAFVPALLTPGKLAREAACKAIQDEVGEKLVEKFGAEKVTEFVIKDAFYYIQKEAVRAPHPEQRQTPRRSQRFDRFAPSPAKSASCPRAHGSAIFARGETQAVSSSPSARATTRRNSIPTPAAPDEQEIHSALQLPEFLRRRNRPHQRSRSSRNRSRRARRTFHRTDDSVSRIIPTRSASPARSWNPTAPPRWPPSAAAPWPSWMPGVPMIRPVAGISIGICTDYSGRSISSYKLLTDIIGWEDAFCDMDCKIAGTEKGITGFQLDLKLKRHPARIMAETVEKARVARLFILGEMAKTIAEPRKELSKYAPRIITIKINPEKIGALIGPGGKNIKRIVEESGCEINIEDDGTVKIYSVAAEGMEDRARNAVEGMTAEAEDRPALQGQASSRSKNLAPSSNSSPARTASATSANWPTSASSRPRTSSRWATKSGSNAWAWMKKAASNSPPRRHGRARRRNVRQRRQGPRRRQRLNRSEIIQARRARWPAFLFLEKGDPAQADCHSRSR